MTCVTMFLTIAALAVPGLSVAEPNESPQQAMRVLDEFMRAFNARDEKAWTATLHFPHVRIASGATRLDATPEAMLSGFDFERFAKRFEWHHSAWHFQASTFVGHQSVSADARAHLDRHTQMRMAKRKQCAETGQRRSDRWCILKDGSSRISLDYPFLINCRSKAAHRHT